MYCINSHIFIFFSEPPVSIASVLTLKTTSNVSEFNKKIIVPNETNRTKQNKTYSLCLTSAKERLNQIISLAIKLN